MSAAASEEAPAPTAPARRYCIGVDPGSVNMGVAVYDLDKKKCCRLMRVQLRPPGTGGDDIGHHRLMLSLAKWILSERSLFQESFVFVENQPPDARDEIVGVQHGLQMACTMLGVPCRAVNAGSYKARFDEHFPRHPRFFEFQPHRRKENQKAYDRRSAVSNGKKLIDDAVVSAYERQTASASKNDDAYEAFFIAWYGAIALVGEDSASLLPTPRPAPRRKVADGPHQRGRVKKTKAQAKREERAKAKAAAAATAAASSTDGPEVVDLTTGTAKRMQGKQKVPKVGSKRARTT